MRVSSSRLTCLLKFSIDVQVSGTDLSGHDVYWKCFTSLLSLFCRKKRGRGYHYLGPENHDRIYVLWNFKHWILFLSRFYYCLMHGPHYYCTIILLLSPRWTNVLWNLPKFLLWQLARWCLRTFPHPCQASTDGKSPVAQHRKSWMIQEVAPNRRELHQCIWSTNMYWDLWNDVQWTSLQEELGLWLESLKRKEKLRRGENFWSGFTL